MLPPNNLTRESQENLRGVDSDLVSVICQASLGISIRVLEGLRTPKRQQHLYDSGKTKTLKSKHVIGKAVDLIWENFRFDDWENRERFFYHAGYIQRVADSQHTRIRWGGDWDSDMDFTDQSFDDLVHFELS